MGIKKKKKKETSVIEIKFPRILFIPLLSKRIAIRRGHRPRHREIKARSLEESKSESCISSVDKIQGFSIPVS